MSDMSIPEKQARAQAMCFAGLQAAFADVGMTVTCVSELRSPTNPLQRFPVAMRNGPDDHNGAVFENAKELVESMYDRLGTAVSPGTSFEYKVFDLQHISADDVLDFIDECDDPDDVLAAVRWWQHTASTKREKFNP